MNWELIKHKFCRLVVTAFLLLGGVMVSAAASGTMPLWAALLGTPAAEPRTTHSCTAGTLPESAYPYLL